MSYRYGGSTGYSGASGFAQEQMMKDVTDMIRLVLEKIAALEIQIKEMAEDIEDICGELFSEEDSETPVAGQPQVHQVQSHPVRSAPRLEDLGLTSEQLNPR